MSLKNIYARIPQHLLEKLSALAEMRQLNTSEMIRGILQQFFDCVDDKINELPSDSLTAQDLAKDVFSQNPHGLANLIGTLENSPMEYENREPDGQYGDIDW